MQQATNEQAKVGQKLMLSTIAKDLPVKVVEVGGKSDIGVITVKVELDGMTDEQGLYERKLIKFREITEFDVRSD